MPWFTDLLGRITFRKKKTMLPFKTMFDFSMHPEDRSKLLVREMTELGYTFVGRGKDRYTFLSPNKRFVIKVPRWQECISANEREARRWKETLGKPDPDGVVYAPCRLMKSGLLMMWAVTTAYGDTYGCAIAREAGLNEHCSGRSQGADLPEWVHSVDCGQVGLLANGKLVAYDYAG